MNKDKVSWFLNKFFFIHPVAIVLIFIINSYELVRYNESVSSIEIIVSITLTLAFLLLSYLLFKKVINNKYKAAILTSSILFFFLFFFDISNFAFSLDFIKMFARLVFFNKQTTTLVILFSVFMALLSFYLAKYNKEPLRLNWFLNVITIIFLSMRIVQFVQGNSIIITLRNNDQVTNNNSSKDTPDIYYIILDSYTGNKSLKKYWNFDNAEFTEYLKSQGFYIAESNCNYNQTPFSLSSSLNMSYLDFKRKNNISNEHFHHLLELIKNSKVVDFLNKNDYKILNYSFFDIPNAPKFYKDYFFLIDGFFSQSIISTIYSKISGSWNTNEITNLAQNNLTVINNIKNFKIIGNKHFFIYAHLLLPHFPYFFDKNGKLMPIEYANDAGNRIKYFEQLRYTNKLIKDCIDSILIHSESKPIIIIQGDHGFRYLKNKDQLAESFTILNAYYFPDQNYNLIYDSISPVNSFRIIFNKYFNKCLPLLKDSTVNVLPKQMFSR